MPAHCSALAVGPCSSSFIPCVRSSTSSTRVPAAIAARSCQRSRATVVQTLAYQQNTSTSQGQQGQLSKNDADMLRNAVSSQFQYSVRRSRKQSTASGANPITEFVSKVQLAWKIFFPEAPKELSPKEEVKRRLRMVLVADRCGMSPASLSEMKKTIVKALQDYVDIEGEEGIEVSISTEPGLGTVYSVNIPVRRVKAETRFSEDGSEEMMPDGVTLEWDPMDKDSDPSSRFPMGC